MDARWGSESLPRAQYGRAPRWAGAEARLGQLQLGRSRICWVEAGSGQPLLLLHGFGGTARWWSRNLQRLAETRRVYALDLPGFGRSHSPERYRLTAAADSVAAWMEASALQDSDLVAHSMGGQLALLLAAQHPQLVRSLVLAAPAGIPFSTGLPGIAWRAFRSRMRGDPRFTALVLAGAARTSPRVLWQAVQQIRLVDVRTLLSTVTTPTLILWGDRDRLIPIENATIFAAALRSAQLQRVPGGGHNLMYDQAELFNQAVLEFLNSASVRSVPIGQPSTIDNPLQSARQQSASPGGPEAEAGELPPLDA